MKTKDTALEINKGNITHGSMFYTLLYDYFSSDCNRKEKRQCYKRYASLLGKTLFAQVSSPLMYIPYYLLRKPITEKLQEFYALDSLDNIENVGKDIAEQKVDAEELKAYMGSFYYNLWLYGDTKAPVLNGGVPDDYKKNISSMFLRRWLYSAVRNPRWNATYVNNYSAPVVKIVTPIDTRSDVNTHNYGTGDTRLGMWLRWYIDTDGKWWFFYENTTKTEKNKGRLFYFGAVGLGSKADGVYEDNLMQGKYEFSLNRTVTIDTLEK